MGASDGPEHARLFEALTDDGAATGLDHAGPDEEALAAELGILLMPLNFPEVVVFLE